MSELMRAVVATAYGSPEILRVAEVEKPVPKDHEVLVQIQATIVTPSDCAIRKADPFIARFFTGLTKPKRPIPGCELSGVIEAVGSRVKRFQPGDHVYGATALEFGAHAEYLCLTEESALTRKPANLNFGEAAGVCDGGLGALNMLRDKGRIHEGQSVLINGASGSVGTFAVQLAKYFGAAVTGVCSTANLKLVASLGADQVIDYTKTDYTDNLRAYDVIFDTVGKSSFNRSKAALKDGGIFLTLTPSAAIYPQMMWTAKYGRKKAIIAAPGLRTANEKRSDLDFLRELIESGKLKSVVDRRYPLEQIAEAHRYVELGHKKGSVVISVRSDGVQ